MFDDITDIILTSENIVHDSTMHGGQDIIAWKLKTLYNRLYGADNNSPKPINLIYMIYGALFTLPYTKKLEINNVEAILLKKNHHGTKILVSYKGDELSVKFLAFKFRSDNMNKPVSYRLANTLYQELKKIKNGKLTKERFRQVLTKLHSFHIYLSPEGRIDIEASEIRLNIPDEFDTYNIYTEVFSKILPSEPTRGAFETNLINMNSKSAEMVNGNAHRMVQNVIETYQSQTTPIQLSKDLNRMYSFVIGAFELNFGEQYNLIIQPIYDALAISFVELRIEIQGQNRPWLSSAYPIMFKFISASESEWETYKSDKDPVLAEDFDKTFEPLYKLGTQANKAICLNAHYDGVLANMVTHNDIDYEIPMRSVLRSKILPVTIPYKDFIGAISKLLTSSTNSESLGRYTDYAQDAFESFRDKYSNSQINPNTFECYLFGILSSSQYSKIDNVEFYQFQHREEFFNQYITTLCFLSKSKSKAIVLNMVQAKRTEDFSRLQSFLHNHYPKFARKLGKIIRITINTDPNFSSVFTDQVIPVDDKNKYLRGRFRAIASKDSVSVFNVLSKSRDSEYIPLTKSHEISKLLDVPKSFLGSRHLSIDGIHFFMRGFFSAGHLIDLKNMPGIFGIVNSDQVPLFISITDAECKINCQRRAKENLQEILERYLPEYSHNPSRRAADFVSIVTSPSSRYNEKIRGIMRISTTGRFFRGCLTPNGPVRKKRNVKLACKIEDFHDKTGKDTEPEELDKDFYSTIEESEKQAVDTKIVPLERTNHMSKVSKISQTLMGTVVIKDMIGALIRGDYNDFAMNTAFLLGAPLIESLSLRINAFGGHLISTNNALVGKTLLITTPFLARLPMQGFVVYDLIQQINRFKAGDEDAKVNIIGDSTILATEFVTAGIDGAAALGYLTTAAEVAGPIGMAIGTAIFISVDIYTAVRTVAKIENQVHLTGWERFTSGLLSFLHIGPTSKVQYLVQEKRIADASAKNAQRFFHEHSYAKNYFFPKYKSIDGNLEYMDNNYADLKVMKKKWNRVWPEDIAGLKLTCAPYDFNNHNTDYSMKTNKVLHKCQDMFGYENLNNSDSDITIILLGTGNDTVIAAPDKNTFIIGDGFKHIVGNIKMDTFLLQGNASYGSLNGVGGSDILNLNNYAKNRSLIIDLRESNGYIASLTYHKEMIIQNIYGFIGRENIHETLTCDCNTKFLDTMGGTYLLPDQIDVRDDSFCVEMRINIQGYIKLDNHVKNGSFVYNVKTENLSSNISFAENDQSEHFLSIQTSISNISSITISRTRNDSHNYDATIHFNGDGKLTLTNSNESNTFIFGNDTEMRIVKDTIQIITSAYHETVEDTVNEYATVASRLNAVIHAYTPANNVSFLFGCGKAAYHGSDENINHINMLPSDPYRKSYLVGCSNNQNVYRISVPDLHSNVQSGQICHVDKMKSVIILNTGAAIQYVPDVLDLFELTILIKMMCNSQLLSRFVISDTGDIVMELIYKNGGDEMTLLNITMINIDIDYSIVVNMRRPMEFSFEKDGDIKLKPRPILKHNDSLININVFEIEPYTKIISSKTIGRKYDKLSINNTSLLITNAQYVINDEDFVVVHLADFFMEEEMQTLDLYFEDEHIRFPHQYYDPSDFEAFEDLMSNNV